VERVPSEGRGRPAQFIPIRFIFTNKLTKEDKLMLALDALVLSEMLARKVSPWQDHPWGRQRGAEGARPHPFGAGAEASRKYHRVASG